MDARKPGLEPDLFIGLGALVLAALLGWGASGIPGDAGYAGVGPNFLPWVVTVAMAACGVALIHGALTGARRDAEPPSGAAQGDWKALAWVVAGLAANALLIERVGFVLACALCYTLAVHGLRSAEGKPWRGPRGTLADAVIGMALSLPVFWLFTRLLKVNLPGLTGTGWL